MQTDPEELKDVSKTQAAVVAAMDALLKSVVDYQAVDLECKREDKKLYQTFIVDKSTHAQVVQQWKKTYRGFDCGATDCAAGGMGATGDWAKVVSWHHEEL